MFPLRDEKPAGIFPFWTILIIAANVYVFFLELVAPNTDRFIAQYALIPARIDFLNWESLAPFVTSQFLHGGFLHIISNMWFLWIFGDNVEKRLGFFFYPLFYVFAGVVGGFLQYIVMPGSTIPMLGASGAVAGVLGAYYANFPNHRIRTLVPLFFLPIVINIPAGVMLIYWFVTQLFSSVASITVGAVSLGGIAYLAHVGGFVTGLFTGRGTRREWV